jgi:hypothetical protein
VTYYRIEHGLAEMLSLSLEHLLPEKAKEWQRHLQRDRLSAEMRGVFAATGWLSSTRDSRLQEEDPDEAPKEEVDIDIAQSDGAQEAEPVSIREPRVKRDHGET